MNRRDREIAVRAIAERATGTPEEAAAQILAGIAVLDGQRLPILLWSPGTGREEKAAWHRSEAAYWDESAARFAAFADDDQHRKNLYEAMAKNGVCRTEISSASDRNDQGQK